MKILVCIKQVPDLDSVDPISGQVDKDRLLYIMNPADEGGLELALQLDAQVEVVTLGPERSDAVCRRALAAGADAVLRVWEPELDESDTLLKSSWIAAAIKKGELPDLILCGARSDDSGSGLFPGLLAGRLGWPVLLDLTHFEMRGDTGDTIIGQRLAAGGAREEVEVKLPAVLALRPDLARLRDASLPAYMRASRAEIPVWGGSTLPLTESKTPFERSLHPRRPRPHAIFTPNSRLSSDERALQIVSAGVSRESGRILDGDPDSMVEEIYAFLNQRGFLSE